MAFVLAVYAESVASVAVLARPLIIAMLIGTLLFGLVRMLVGDWPRAAFITTLLLLAVTRQWVAIIAVVALIELIIVVSYIRRAPIGPGQLWHMLTRGGNVVTALLIVISLSSLAIDGRLIPTPTLAMTRGPVDERLPDVYVVVLDGYPRSDTLLQDFGLDIDPFEKSLEKLGFDVADRSYSNYNITVLTLASMLEMRQIPRIPELGQTPPDEHSQYLAMASLLASAAGLEKFIDLGYEIVNVPSEFDHLGIHSANRYLAGGTMSPFELDVLTSTLAREVIPDGIRAFAAEQHRLRIKSSLATMGELASERTGRPKFVLTHVLAPHTPVVLALDGPAPDGPKCFPQRCVYWSARGDGTVDARAGEAEQVRALNVLVLAAVQEILSQSARPPVIILMSDHGHRLDPDDQDEMFRNFFAAYTPGHSMLFPDDVSPVTVLPRLLDAYAGLSVPLDTDESYAVALDRIGLQGFLVLGKWEVVR